MLLLSHHICYDRYVGRSGAFGKNTRVFETGAVGLDAYEAKKTLDRLTRTVYNIKSQWIQALQITVPL